MKEQAVRQQRDTSRQERDETRSEKNASLSVSNSVSQQKSRKVKFPRLMGTLGGGGGVGWMSWRRRADREIEGDKSKCKKHFLWVHRMDGGHSNHRCASGSGNCYFTLKQPPSRAAAEQQLENLTGWKRLSNARSRGHLIGHLAKHVARWLTSLFLHPQPSLASYVISSSAGLLPRRPHAAIYSVVGVLTWRGGARKGLQTSRRRVSEFKSGDHMKDQKQM